MRQTNIERTEQAVSTLDRGGSRTVSPDTHCCVCGYECRCPQGMRVIPVSRRDDRAVAEAEARR